MAIAPSPNDSFEEVLDFLAAGRTTEEILAFQPSEALQQRSHYLFERNRQDSLTAEERIELEDLMRINHFVNMLKIRARQKLAEGA